MNIPLLYHLFEKEFIKSYFDNVNYNKPSNNDGFFD